ncbi:triple tyrosine motif-containing protein [Pedobacter sp. SYP-B3415]|uniref:ligand-binding sensor domain-containing protein n=1 Tax=Pedobacter sp. SYP-B3415 TaxID=2496641 RepID=UPI001F103164|nr:triple tyrosine motif-containing protein [Pedobacter sp. SYP-B3415]
MDNDAWTNSAKSLPLQPERNRMLKVLIYTSLFLLSLSAHAVQDPGNIHGMGVPYVQNYAKTAYRSGNQNWSVTKDEHGIMYFGNAEGLLSFDGRYWQKYTMPQRQIVRAVAADRKGRIYVGSFGEFGYWSYRNGRLVYQSLTKLIPQGLKVTDEIWKIYIDGDRILFQSFSSIYIYKDQHIDIVKSPEPFLFLHKAGSRFFAEVIGFGLYELKGKTLHPLPDGKAISKSGVLSILPYSGDRFLIGTNRNGLFLYDGKKFSPFASPANNFLMTYQLNNGVKLKGDYYAYGTILNGIIILDRNGYIVQKINKSSGLQNNTVLSLYTDEEQNLWTGLDNGIDRVELNSALYFYFDKAGQFGTVYSSIIDGDKIYLGTNQGLFYSNWKPENGSVYTSFNFRLVPNSQGQVWDLSRIDGQLLCGHNDGTFRIRNGGLEQISSENGGWTINRLQTHPDKLIQGTYTGLVIYKKDLAGNWIFSHKVSGFREPARYVEQDSRGDIWVGHAYKGLYKLKLSPDLRRVISQRSYSDRDGLPGTYNVSIFNLERKTVFSTDTGFFTFDEISNRFSSYDALNKSLGSFAASNKIIPAGDRRYWFISRGRVALGELPDGGRIRLDSTRFSILDGRMVQYYENISRINTELYLISVDDGFAIFNNARTIQAAPQNSSVLIRGVEDITDTYATLTEHGETDRFLELENSRNNIRITYALPYYRQANIRYQYYLDGYSQKWSDWSTATEKDFTNLGSGTYVFSVRAMINNGKPGPITRFEFRVLPPWYGGTIAFIVYAILAAVALYAGKLIYERKLKRDQQKITAQLQREQEEYLQREAEANEKQIIRLQTEKLQAELAGKNRELANSAMSLVYKNELLQKLSQEIIKIRDSSGQKLPEDQLRKIQKVIDEGMNDERDWNLFETSFNEAHESFFKKLKVNHPDLVPNDLKLCAYLRLNMSSKEIASLLNISLRGVEIRRYRLRKKLNIAHDKNLTEFLIEM